MDLQGFICLGDTHALDSHGYFLPSTIDIVSRNFKKLYIVKEWSTRGMANSYGYSE